MTIRFAKQSLLILAIAAQTCLVSAQQPIPQVPQQANPVALQNYMKQQAAVQQQAMAQQRALAQQQAMAQQQAAAQSGMAQPVHPYQAMMQNQAAMQNFAMQQQAYMRQQQAMIHQQAMALQQAAAQRQTLIQQQQAMTEAQRVAQAQRNRIQSVIGEQQSIARQAMSQLGGPRLGLAGQNPGRPMLNRPLAGLVNQRQANTTTANPGTAQGPTTTPPVGAPTPINPGANTVPGTNSVMTHSQMAQQLSENAYHQSPNETISATIAEQGQLGMASDALLQEAMAYEKAGQVADAIERYHRALEKDPGNWRALISFGRLKHRLGDLDGAIYTYQQVLKIHDNDPVALNDLGLCYARRGDLGNALTCLHKAVSLQEKSKRYRNNLATVLIEAGQLDAAFTTLKEAHGEAIGEFNMGYLLSRRKQNMEAAAHLKRALELDPSLTPARKLLASIGAAAADPTRVASRSKGPVKIEPVEKVQQNATVAPTPSDVKLQSAEIELKEFVSRVAPADYETKQPESATKIKSWSKSGDLPPDPQDYKIPGIK